MGISRVTGNILLAQKGILEYKVPTRLTPFGQSYVKIGRFLLKISGHTG